MITEILPILKHTTSNSMYPSRTMTYEYASCSRSKALTARPRTMRLTDRYLSNLCSFMFRSTSLTRMTSSKSLMTGRTA